MEKWKWALGYSGINLLNFDAVLVWINVGNCSNSFHRTFWSFEVCTTLMQSVEFSRSNPCFIFIPPVLQLKTIFGKFKKIELYSIFQAKQIDTSLLVPKWKIFLIMTDLVNFKIVFFTKSLLCLDYTNWLYQNTKKYSS